jgi:hypothetical protein
MKIVHYSGNRIKRQSIALSGDLAFSSFFDKMNMNEGMKIEVGA